MLRRAGAELPRWPRPRTFGTLPTVAFHIFAAPLPPLEDEVGCSGSLELSAAYTDFQSGKNKTPETREQDVDEASAEFELAKDSEKMEVEAVAERRKRRKKQSSCRKPLTGKTRRNGV